ncbi:polymorphic toxin type 15 domain-containing protein [Agathobacter rectalis]|uniref:polymorphic toxin type 15 domain-containing protein n=1 Tax=Agathobacter rectalis TaxID=39491 RepID=UPI0034A420ED
MKNVIQIRGDYCVNSKLSKAPRGIDGVTEGAGNVAEYEGKIVEGGDKGVNSSIGSQWRYRIDDVDAQIKKWQRVCLKQRKIQHILM